MSDLRDILRGSDVVRAAFDLSNSSGQNIYLVGGTVRDLLIHSRLGNDFDFAVEGKGIPFARAFADRVGGSFFFLDEERDSSRVVFKMGVCRGGVTPPVQESGARRFQADFSGIRGSIEEDLRMRDFTINSLAIPLDERLVISGQWTEASLIDPTGGRGDIDDRVLRATSPNVLKEDPLRILRAFRFSSALRFRIGSELMDLIREEGDMLGGVSAERVRAELFMILEMSGACNVINDMDEAGILRILFPEVEKWKGFHQGGWHAHDLFDHSMRTVDASEDLLSRLNHYFPSHGKEIEALMGEELEAHVSRRGLLKLASLLHDSGKFYTRTMEGGRGRFLGHERAGEGISAGIARGLKLSRRSEKMLRVLTLNHMRVLGLSKLKKVTGRARFRFFRDAEGFGLDLLLLSLADAMATPIEGKRIEELKRLVQGLADYYFEEFITVPPRPLLTGEDIMRVFGIPQGKRVGEMLESLREAEIMGKVSNRREAVNYLKKYFKKVG